MQGSSAMGKNLQVLLVAVVMAMVLTVGVKSLKEPLTLDAAINGLQPYLAGCDPKPEREHLKELVLSVENPQRATKCLQFCLMDKTNMIDEKNGIKVNEKNSIAMLAVMYPGREDDLKVILKTCNDQNGSLTDKCEAAFAHSECWTKEMKAKGFDIPEIKE